MSKDKKMINIDVSELPFNEKRKVVDELTDIYTAEDYRTHIDHKHIKFVVPISGLSRKEAESKIRELVKEYSTPIEWDDSKGELFLPNNHVDHSKEIWYPVREENYVIDESHTHKSTSNSSTYKKFIVSIGESKINNFLKRLFSKKQ